MSFATLRLIALALTLAGATAACACGPAPQARAQGEYLVTLAAQSGVEAIVELYARFGIKGIQDLGRNVFLVSLTEDPGPDRMEQLRADNARIQAVQPNLVYGTREPARLPHVR